MTPTPSPPQLVRELLAKGKETGFNVMRTWAHSVNPQYAMQVWGAPLPCSAKLHQQASR